MVGVDDLDEPQRAILDAIVRGGPDPRRALAWSLVARLELAGHATEAVESVVGLGLAERWQAPEGECLTLTPYGACLLEVHILERMTIVGDELSEDPYWAELAKEPPPLHLPKRQHEIRWPWMDELPDPKTVHPEREQGNVVDEVSGKEIELFAQLFDGRQVKGVTIKIDKRLKGAKQPKRRRAG